MTPVPGGLVPCTGVTGSDVLVHERSYPRPCIFSGHQIERFLLSQVACCLPIVVSLQNPQLDLRVLWNIPQAPLPQQSLFCCEPFWRRLQVCCGGGVPWQGRLDSLL